MHQHWFSVFSFYIDSEGELSQSHGIKYYVPCDNSQISSPASNSSSRGTRICNWLVNSSILTLNRNLKFNIFITWALDFHPQPFKKIAHLVFPHFCNKLCSSSCLGQKLEVVLYLIFFLFHRHPNQHLIVLALLSIHKCMHLRVYVFTHTYLRMYFPFHLPPSTLPYVFFTPVTLTPWLFFRILLRMVSQSYRMNHFFISFRSLLKFLIVEDYLIILYKMTSSIFDFFFHSTYS